MSKNKLTIGPELLEKIIEEAGPEFEVQLQQAVLENVLSRTVKAVAPDKVRKEFKALVEETVAAVVKETIGEVKRSWQGTTVNLDPNFKKEIEHQVLAMAEKWVDAAIPSADKHIANLIDYKLASIEALVDQRLNKMLSESLAVLISKKFQAITVEEIEE